MNKILFYLLLTILSATVTCSCKNTAQEEQKSQTPTDSNTITPQREVSITESDTVSDNEILVTDDFPMAINHDTIIAKKGKYINKSTAPKYVQTLNRIVEPETIKDTSLLKSLIYRYYYLPVKQPIALFSRMHPKSESDVIGILNKPSFAIVDTIFYNDYYKEEIIEGRYLITYDLWYAIRINDRKYYTDFKPYDFQAYKAYIPQKNQVFMIYAEDTGYDEFPDRGYPDFFTAIVIEKDDRNEWKIVSSPTLLDFFPEGEEYFDYDWLDHQIDNKGNFILQTNETLDNDPVKKDRIKWDGKKFTKLY